MIHSIQEELELKHRELRRRIASETDAAKKFQMLMEALAIEERLSRIG